MFQNWNTSRYGEPLLKIFSVQALLRVSIDYLVGISLIHWVNKAFSKWWPQVPGLSCLFSSIHSFISYYSYSAWFQLILPIFALFIVHITYSPGVSLLFKDVCPLFRWIRGLCHGFSHLSYSSDQKLIHTEPQKAI